MNNIHHEKHLLLDPAIRDWVVLPMFIMLILVAMGRVYVSNLIKSVPVVTGMTLMMMMMMMMMMMINNDDNNTGGDEMLMIMMPKLLLEMM